MHRTRARRLNARKWLFIGAASLVLHGLVGWALLIGVPTVTTMREPPHLAVELIAPVVEPAPSAPVRADRAPSGGATKARRTQAESSAVAPSPFPAAPGAIVAPPGFTARGTLTGGGEALREAARKSGCTEADIVKLTKVEREACAEALGAKNKNGPALYAAIDPDKKAAFDGDCKKDDDWCLYRTGKGPYPGLFAIGKKKKIKGWD